MFGGGGGKRDTDGAAGRGAAVTSSTRTNPSTTSSRRFVPDVNNLIAPNNMASSIATTNPDFPKYMKQEPTNIDTNSSMNDPVVACLKQQQSKTPKSTSTSSTTQVTASGEQTSHPYTAIALSPCQNYAVTACKGTLQIVRVSPAGLRVVKTIVAAQYFQVSSSTASTIAGSASLSGNNSKIGTIMDSSLFTRADSNNPTAPPTTNTASNMINNVTITDVAWSNLPTIASSSPSSGNDPNSAGKDDNTAALSMLEIDGGTTKAAIYEDYDSEINRSHQQRQQSEMITTGTTSGAASYASECSRNTSMPNNKARQSSTSNNNPNMVQQQTATDHHQQLRKNQPTAVPTHSTGSLIAAAGSNGAIVIWNAETLLDQHSTMQSSASKGSAASSSFISESSQSGKEQNVREKKQQQQTTQQQQQHSMLPEAVLSQHFGRVINRLAWHPKKHGLLLSASQDGTVILWERRLRVSSQQPNTNKQRHSDNIAGTMAADDTVVSSSSFLSTSPLQGVGLVTSSIGRSTASSGRGGGIFSNLFGFSSMNKSVSTATTASSFSGPMKTKSAYQWNTRSTYEPKSESIRDIRWSPYYDDVFALVTISGSLIAYNMHIPARALVKMAAHSGDATTLDWHPLFPNVLATGGASDRCVKVWNLEMFLSFLNTNNDINNNKSTNANTISFTSGTKDDYYNIFANMNTLTSRAESVLSDSSWNESYNNALSVGASLGASSAFPYLSAAALRSGSSASTSFLNTSRHKSMPKNLLHVLSVSASVTRLRWRPPAYRTSGGNDDNNDYMAEEDRHESMMAVATAPVKGASAGGSGMLALWSYYRPFMPLSVVEGHKEGAVTDFRWLDTPRIDRSKSSSGIQQSLDKSYRAAEVGTHNSILRHGASDPEYDGSQYRSTFSKENDHVLGQSEDDTLVGIWQHVLSVGRDGRCLVQSLARGYRPISKVPPSCFAMGNLSPFHKGYGSLQILSVCQKVPSSAASDFALTGLRRDGITANAPGIFREIPVQESKTGSKELSSFPPDWVSRTKLPSTDPQIMFSVVDQGDLDDELVPVEDEDKVMIIGPEVVHMSRFAERYKLYPDDRYSSRVDMCLHNADVAESLRSPSLAHMWRMVASLVKCSRTNGLPDIASQPKNAIQFAILPTIHKLLEERADAGDVQTCVALCEVLEVLTQEQTVRIPGFHIDLVREWYLSYIDLLRDMCLFSHATFLIRSCKDPYINALNQQSTTIHESCPQCGKALLGSDGASRDQDNTARRLCKSCRRRVGLCFLCHQPVKGLYVWCPGCGHGGHLDHALQWFGGLNGKPLREYCPTGCGHRCNMFQRMEGIPKDYVIDMKDVTGE